MKTNALFFPSLVTALTLSLYALSQSIGFAAEAVTKKIDLLEIIKSGKVDFHINPDMDVHDAPQDIWKFQADGTLHVSGRGYGYVATKENYRDYHLVIEFKWGEKTWGKREKAARDNGILLHSHGPHGAYSGTWMASIECQIIEGGVGDILVLSPKLADGTVLTTSLSAEIALDRDKEKMWKKGEPRQAVTSGRINWYGRDVDWKDAVGFRGREEVELPFGQWNRLEVIAKGDTLQYILNGSIVNEAFECKPSEGKILLQTEGAEMIVRRYELNPLGQAPNRSSSQSLGNAKTPPSGDLGKAVVFHASFDNNLNADYSRGDKACCVKQGKDTLPAVVNDDVALVSSGGRFGGALHFPKKGTTRPQFKGEGMLGYNDKSWSASVSVWLKLDPDKDLEPGYCDPVQIVGDDTNKGFIFLEWSKDESPRHFRFAIRPKVEIWNPQKLDWAKMTAKQRPAVNLERAPFSRENWTHAVFTFENINDKANKPVGRLYLNGELKGSIENWDLTFGWDPAQVFLVLGASYVGYLDDLAVFNRALTAGEVKQVYTLKNGIKEAL